MSSFSSFRGWRSPGWRSLRSNVRASDYRPQNRSGDSPRPGHLWALTAGRGTISRYNLQPVMSGAIAGSGQDLVFRARLEPSRRIAGALLAVIGAAIAVQLARGIAANKASTHAAWSGYLPVVLVFGGVALAFLLPGVLMLLYRRDVRVDAEHRQVVVRQTYLGFGRTRTYAWSSFKKIVLARRFIWRSRSGSSSGSSHARRSYPFFVVELMPTGGKPVRIVTDQRQEPVRDAAAKLAALTRLVVADQIERERARKAAGSEGEDA